MHLKNAIIIIFWKKVRGKNNKYYLEILCKFRTQGGTEN